MYLLLLLAISPLLANSQEVLGCGGYIMSAVDIDYSHVTIKLLTPQGNEKYETECAPNNGYYFIPIYDKGDYIIKVFSPSGWTFEPSEFPINIDGSTDSCSLGKDINFQFGGFAVVGKVVSTGSNEGPSGITVSLLQEGKKILATTTSEGGRYLFTPLAPGNYVVQASHQTWTFKKIRATVHVTDKNGDAGNSLVMDGFHLSGSVSDILKYTSDFYLVLHGTSIADHSYGCTRGIPQGYSTKLDQPPLCYVKAQKTGTFSFTKLLSGKYTLAPHFPSQNQHNIWPPKFEFEVKQRDVTIGSIFKVNGGSLEGKVLRSVGGKTLSGAKVTLDGGVKTTTDNSGSYSFSRVEFGKHTISVEAPDVEFEDLAIDFSMDTPTVPDILPSKFKACFGVHLDSADRFTDPWKVTISSAGTTVQTLMIRSNSKQCLNLSPRTYKAEIIVSKEARQLGVRFSPDHHNFQVTSDPAINLSFSQFLGELHGTITCLTDCPNLTVHLRSESSSVSPQTTISSQNRFVFHDVTPGSYIVSVDKEEWCWKDQYLKVVVDEKKVSVKFLHQGYRLTIHASHQIPITYSMADHSGSIDVPTGTSRHCMPLPGKYTFKHSSCHRFEVQDMTWDSASPQLLSLIAQSHLVPVHLKSQEPSSFMLSINSGSEVQKEVPFTVSRKDKILYTLEYWAPPKQQVVLSPRSPSNLFQFTPESATIDIGNDCVKEPIVFSTQRALFLKGSVEPPVKGANIVVFDGENTVTHPTNAEGIFVVGPLDRSKSYKVTAEKPGYTVDPSELSFDTTALTKAKDVVKAHFNVHKLAEIIVKVVDENDVPLSGVLVSTTGGKNYRQNSLTEDDGTFTFQSLLPNEYFVRPMMKEYLFTPSSKMVEVKGGESVNLVVKGSRVAFSIFGKTVTLNGQPEPDVVLEVVGTGDKCSNMQEETTTDASGNYRIRGLVPQCQYVFQMKKGPGINQHLELSIPPKREIMMKSQDVFDVDLVLMRPFNQMEVAVMIRTDKQFLSTISAQLYRDSMPDSPLHVVKANNHPFVMFPFLVSDNRSYTIVVTSSLPRSKYIFEESQTSFVADSSFKMFHMNFEAQLKTEEAEISNSTIFGLLLFVICVTCGFNYERLQPVASNLLNSYNTKTKKKVVNVSSDTPHIEPVPVARKVRARKT